jgi:hypothetical protein
LSKWPKFGPIALLTHPQDHEQARSDIVRMHEKAGPPQMLAMLRTEPANHFHATIRRGHVRVRLAPKIVIEMDLIPVFDQTRHAIRGRGYPDRAAVFLQENLGTDRVIVKKQPARRLTLPPRSVPPPMRDQAQVRKPMPISAWSGAMLTLKGGGRDHTETWFTSG